MSLKEATFDLFESEHLPDFAEVEWEKFQSSVLIEVKRGENVFTSSAVIIARNVLLTCAHSVEGIQGGRVFWDAQYQPDSSNFVKFKRVVLHPNYDQKKSNYENDLAIIVLRNNLPSKARCAKISSSSLGICEGMQAHRIGFGAREGVNVRTWTNPEIKSYDHVTKTFVLHDCYGHVGDSGGPLFVKVGTSYRLFALHSTREGEDKTYTVSVADHLPWIRENMELRQV